MATYNGEPYLAKQLNSIISQTHSNWELIIRDDGSSDSTCSIIEDFMSLDSRIFLHKDNLGNLRSCQNFSTLMELPLIDTQYIMFCDQDDIWLPNKIQKSLESIKLLEEEHGTENCLMSYGTYSMIDENDSPLSLPAPDYSMVPDLTLLLSQNYVYGCTLMINKRLLECSAPIPNTAENHDYWIALTAAINNSKIAYIKEPLILYRQHSNNVSGSYKDGFLLNRIKRFTDRSEIKIIKSRLSMFLSLYERFKDTMGDREKLLIEGYIRNVDKGGLRAFLFCFKNGIGRRGRKQTVLFYFNLLRS